MMCGQVLPMGGHPIVSFLPRERVNQDWRPLSQNRQMARTFQAELRLALNSEATKAVT